MNKENLQGAAIKPNLTDKFFTSDLATAAYLRTKGVNLDVVKKGKKGVFYYEKKYQEMVDNFFQNSENYLTYAMNMRSLKSQIQNMRGGE